MNIEKELYDEITEITKKDYSPIIQKDADEPVLVTSDKLAVMLEDLLKVIDYKNDEIEEANYKIENLNKKMKDLEQDVADNFRRIPIGSQVRVSDGDFRWK